MKIIFLSRQKMSHFFLKNEGLSTLLGFSFCRVFKSSSKTGTFLFQADVFVLTGEGATPETSVTFCESKLKFWWRTLTSHFPMSAQ